jgi:hypothetical protein
MGPEESGQEQLRARIIDRWYKKPGHASKNGKSPRSSGASATTRLAVPPFPAHDDGALDLIVDMAIDGLHSGDTDVRGAVRYAAVHAWLEGHLEGETCTGNCASRIRWQRLPYPDGRDRD